MDYYLKAQLLTASLLLALAGVAGCIRLISAERLDDGSSVLCVKVEPQDAGVQDADPEPIRYRTVPSGIEY